MNSYTPEKASIDLQVIDWLQKAGAITQEDARYMRQYVQSLI